jgi:hypothetical protein
MAHFAELDKHKCMLPFDLGRGPFQNGLAKNASA